MSETWYGWAWLGGQWQRLCGPHGTLHDCSRELTAVLAERTWCLPNRDLALTTGAVPRQVGRPLAAGKEGPV